jgi:TolB-like protein/DNA-binding winged helix-turn-helix (wHTH) protein/Flp pilus assembly protein TadD
MLRDTPTALAPVECIAIGGHTLDLARGELLDAQGHPAGLRAQALKVLLVLGERLGQVVGKDELMRRVWGEVVVTEDSLVQAVGDIRRVLGAVGAEQLRTVPRRGHLLVATEPLPAAAPPVSAEPQAPRHVRRAWGLAVAALGLAALLAIVIAAALWPRADAPASRSLAILPFESDDPQAGDDWFVDAVTGDLNTMVAGWKSGLRVVGRGTMQGYKGKGADPRSVGRELGVAHVLTGRVRREGERVRIAVELVHTADGRVQWARPFEVDRSELPASVGDIAGGIAKALAIDLGDIVPPPAGRLNPAQASADDLAMRGFTTLLRSVGPDNFETARQLFEQAVARDARSLRGLAGVSIVNSMSVSFHYTKDEAAAMRRSQEALDRLETVDANAHMTLLARASHRLSSADWAGQLAVAEELVRHFPNDPTSYHHRCSSMLRLGRFAEAIPACDRAIRISPRESRTPIWHGLAGMNEFMRGRYPEAVERARTAVAGAPKVPGYALLLAAALVHDGRPEEGRAVIDELRVRHPGFDLARAAAAWVGTNAHPDFIAGRDRITAAVKDLGLR